MKISGSGNSRVLILKPCTVGQRVCGSALIQNISLTNNRMGREVLGPGGIWGWVQGVGSDHWGTRSQP